MVALRTEVKSRDAEVYQVDQRTVQTPSRRCSQQDVLWFYVKMQEALTVDFF